MIASRRITARIPRGPAARQTGAALADLLRRAAHLVVETEAIERLVLPRVVVAESEAVVVDAWAELGR